VTPWNGAPNSSGATFWAVSNCDQSASPASQLATAKANFNSTIAGQQIDCSDGFQDVCAEIQREQSCYTSAESVAWSHVTVAGIPAMPPTSGSVTDVVSHWLGTAENSVVSTMGNVLGFANNVANVVDLYGQLGSAYNSCV
jgi:hypothetical protein